MDGQCAATSATRMLTLSVKVRLITDTVVVSVVVVEAVAVFRVADPGVVDLPQEVADAVVLARLVWYSTLGMMLSGEFPVDFGDGWGLGRRGAGH